MCAHTVTFVTESSLHTQVGEVINTLCGYQTLDKAVRTMKSEVALFWLHSVTLKDFIQKIFILLRKERPQIKKGSLCR